MALESSNFLFPSPIHIIGITNRPRAKWANAYRAIDWPEYSVNAINEKLNVSLLRYKFFRRKISIKNFIRSRIFHYDI